MCRLTFLLLLCVLGVVVAKGQVTPIAITNPIERELKSGESHLYQLTLAAGECAVLGLDTEDVSAVWKAWIEKGTVLAGAEFEKSSRLWLVAEQAATFTIEFRLTSPLSSVRWYRLRVTEQRPATDADRNVFQAEVSFQQAMLVANRDDEQSKRQAAEHCRIAATRWDAAGELYYAADAYNLMGLSYVWLDEVAQGTAAFGQALSRFRAVGNHSSEMNTLNNLAALLLRVGEAQQVLDYFGQVPDLHRATVPVRQAARAYINLANAYRMLGDLVKARAFHELGLTTIRSERERSYYTRNVELVALYELGRTCSILGEDQQALDYLKQALEVAYAFGGAFRSSAGRIHRVVGDIHFRRGEYRQAQEVYQTTLTADQEYSGPFYNAQVRNDLGATALKLGRSGEARDWYNDALARGAALNNVLIKSTAHVGLARVEQSQGHFAAALVQIEQALHLIESQRAQIVSRDLRASFLATKREVYELQIDLLAQLAEQEKSAVRRAAAFAASERARARSLLELIGADAGQGVENLDPQLAARDRELRQRISLKADQQTRLAGQSATEERQARLDQELTLLLAEHDRLTAQIRQRHPRYSALADVQPLTLAEVRQQVLDDNTVLLEYALGAERSWLFAVTNTELHSFPLPPRRELEQAARRLHESLAAYGRAKAFTSIQAKQAWQRQQERDWQTAATNLSRMLLAQVSPLLKDKRLLIVPDGALHYVPFAALPVVGSRLSVAGKELGVSRAITNNRQPATDNRQPLIVHHEILTLPSASALAVLRRELGARAPAEKMLVVFADPVYQRNDERVTVAEASARFLNSLERLPATRLEAEAISQLVPASARKVAYGLDANYAAATSAELGQYRYVHFATHGWLDSRRPALSGLVLSQVDAQGATRHATLRTLDVFNLKLNAELVVLSGCQTGLGEEINGEGLVGLSRGFMYAGARRVLASLWQVNDVATAELMQRFYQGMLSKKKLSPAAALREAQLTIFQTPRWQSPYYWAAFTLQGDW